MENRRFSEEFLNKRLVRINEIPGVASEPCQISEYGYFPYAKYHYYRRDYGANENILIVCAQGEGIVEIEKSVYKLTPKTFVIIPKHHAHIYYANNDNPWSIYWFHFYDDWPKSEVIETLSAIKFNAIIGVFQYLIQVTPKDKRDIDYLNTLYVFIKDTIRHVIGSAIINNHVELAINYMNENISGQISVFDIANYSGVSASHLSALFKKHLGIPPFQYYLKLKIEEASHSILATSMSIKDISSALGFEDQFYFSRLFKRYMGVSPLAFKKNNYPPQK